MKEALTPSAEKYIGVIRGLHNATSSDPRISHPIIDIDMAPEHIDPIEHSDLSEYHEELDRLFVEMPKSEQNADLMLDNLQHTNRVVDILTGETAIGSGGETSYPEYIEGTMGVEPSLIPELTLQLQRVRLKRIVKDMGYSYEPESRPGFIADQSIPEEMSAETVKNKAELAKEDVARVFGAGVLQGLDEPLIIADYFSDTWQGRFELIDKKFAVTVNTNPDIRARETDIRATLVHELAHWVSAAIKKQKIEDGELSPTAGVMLFASGSYYQEEVIARAAEIYTLKKQKDVASKYTREQTIYKINVDNNMLLMANSDEYSEDEVAEYGKIHLPFDDPQKIEKSARNYFHKLIYKTVFGIDSEAMVSGQVISLMHEDDRRATLQQLCSGPDFSGRF